LPRRNVTTRGEPVPDVPSPDEVIASLRFDDRGLVPAVVQDDHDSTVLMVAWMDAEAVRRTLTSGRTWFWSRSRQEHWQKGETSGHRQYVRAVAADCDRDTLLVRVEQVGSACHTGTRSCFATPVPAAQGAPATRHGAGAHATGDGRGGP
jgi:phosphoribosyl-AMP cyclohydrolase